MKKIGEINPVNGDTITVYYDQKAKTNNYRVYKEWVSIGEHGIIKHRKLIQKYGNLHSCAILMMEYVRDHDEERRDIKR